MTELPKETKLYQLSTVFARQEKLPVYFVGKVLIETPKAVYLYGRGTLEAQTKFNKCCCCGLTLSHPGSIILGIGPECLNNWNERDEIIKGKSEEELKKITGKLIQDRVIDGWVPKSCIKKIFDTEDIVNVPTDHPKLKPMGITNVERKAIKEGDRLIITFPFSQEDLGRVKSLSGRKYNGYANPKHWTCPITNESVSLLLEWGFVIDGRLTKSTEIAETILDLTGLNKPLYPFQKEGIAYIEKRAGRALIGDEMGLGKTAQALAWLHAHPELRPVVIVVPASLKLNWEREINKWLPGKPKVQILSGQKPEGSITGDFVIINYDILKYWQEKLSAAFPKVVVTDECHYYKENARLRTKAVKALAKGVPHFIALSGTPIINRPIEAFNAINIINKGLFPSWWKYAQRYCGAKHNGFGWDFTGASHTDELHSLLQDVMIRRLKADVLTELPPKTRTIIPMELDNQTEYNYVEADFLKWLKETKGKAAAQRASNAETLTRIEALKQVAVKGKLKAAIDWIQDFIDVDGKLVVFAVHKSTINALMEAFGEIAVKVDGSVSGEKRQAAVDTFQTDPKIRLFVGNIEAAGIGITLTAASNVAFLELGWSPGEHDQAEDRCHRIGQEADSINIHYLLAAGTIEEEIAGLLDSKRKVLVQVLDGKETEGDSLLTELLERYANK